MEKTTLSFQPTVIPEWEAEDEMSGVLSQNLVKAGEKECKEMLDAMRFELPNVMDLNHVKLLQYAQDRQTPLELVIPPDSRNFDFYLIELPLNILVPQQRVTRLRMMLNLEATGRQPGETVAYDLFPNDQTELKTLMTGEVTLDVSKTLKYILSSVGAGTAAPLTEAFGFKLNAPFKWTSTFTKVQTSDRMSNPVEWYITDSSIQNGFTGHVIIRAPKDSQVSVAAKIVCELRKKSIVGFFTKHFISDTQIYPLRS